MFRHELKKRKKEKKVENQCTKIVICSVSARFLWKRIPQSVKSANAELEKMYTVYNFLWHNNIAGFFKAINHEWSNTVAELMFELKGKFIVHFCANFILHFTKMCHSRL